MFDNSPTPLPNNWKRITDEEKKIIINNYLSQKKIYELQLQEFNDQAQIVFKIIKNIPSRMRGMVLLDIEEYLKKNIDEAITVWCSAQQDKSKLRKLRGVELKTV